ncbi:MULTISPECIES: hypothetical protein [unclassified Streptomyces]|uniref:hypothetical protein n=1 Tax=unclassified Streptomyces TaxID=2593676 RepID=UPI00382E92A1
MSRSLRTAVSAALIALSCLLLPFGALAAWAAYDLTDTGRYVTTMAPLASDPDVRDAVVDTVGDGILRRATAERGPLHPEVSPFVHDAVRSFTHTRAYRTAWDAGNEAAHSAVMAALHDDRSGEVTVDLAPVATRVREQLAAERVPFADRVPLAHTRVALLPPGELTTLRKGYHVLDVAGFWLPLAAVVLAVAGIAVAACRRRAVTAAALGTALGGAFLGLAVALGRRLTLADLPDPAHRPAAGAVYDALTTTLRATSWFLLAVGLGLAATVHLAHAVRAAHRRRTAPGPVPAPAPPEPTHAQA